MPIRHAVMHFIDKKPDGSPAVLHLASNPLPDSGAIGCRSSSTKSTCTFSTGTRQSDAECQWWLVRIRPASPRR